MCFEYMAPKGADAASDTARGRANLKSSTFLLMFIIVAVIVVVVFTKRPIAFAKLKSMPSQCITGTIAVALPTPPSAKKALKTVEITNISK
jgi:hypothetical protein